MVDVEICGVRTVEAVDAALAGGAAWVGLNFVPRSLRAVLLELGARLAARAAPSATLVGVFVDPDDARIAEVLATVPLGMIQLHGDESPERVVAVSRRFGLPVMKAIGIAGPDDVVRIVSYEEVGAAGLLDAKPPRPEALSGGNARRFDGELLAGRAWSSPWMLSGALDGTNVAEAVEVTGARSVDVASGVEDEPGAKSPAKIAAFLATARGLSRRGSSLARPSHRAQPG